MDFIYLLTYYFFKLLFNILPKSVLKPILNGIGTLGYYFDKKHRKIAFANLDFCFKETKTREEKEQIVRQMYKNLAFFGYDFIQNQNTTKEKIAQKVHIKNIDILKKALNSDRAVTFQSAHYGMWELIPLSLSALASSRGVSVVGRPLDSKTMDKILLKNRSQFNIQMIDKKNALRQMLKAISQNRLLGVIVDQNTTKSEGVEVSFFGKKVMHSPALSLIHKRTNSIIIPVFIHKIDEFTHELTLYEPLDTENLSIQQITQAQADITEKIIQKKPDEYFWVHKRFKHFYKDLYNA